MLLDTSGLLALFSTHDPQHERARALFESERVRVTHSYVISEFVALATTRGFRRQLVLEYLTKLHDSVEIEIIYVDENLHRIALEFLTKRLDKTWSLCDAVSFVLMQQRNIRDALTTDHHFEQAGFRRLLMP